MLRLAAVVLVSLTVAACSPGATISSAYGTPDIDWTYFRASPAEVISATERGLGLSATRLESTRDGGSGTVMTLTQRGGSSDELEVIVEATDAEDFGARAQVYGRDRRLPRNLERVIRRNL